LPVKIDVPGEGGSKIFGNHKNSGFGIGKRVPKKLTGLAL